MDTRAFLLNTVAAAALALGGLAAAGLGSAPATLAADRVAVGVGGPNKTSSFHGSAKSSTRPTTSPR